MKISDVWYPSGVSIGLFNIFTDDTDKEIDSAIFQMIQSWAVQLIDMREEMTYKRFLTVLMSDPMKLHPVQ